MAYQKPTKKMYRLGSFVKVVYIDGTESDKIEVTKDMCVDLLRQFLAFKHDIDVRKVKDIIELKWFE